MTFSIRSIPKSEAGQQIYRGLQSLSNIEFVTDLICERHALPSSQRQNARKQAESIRSCLEQALEYREAAKKSEYAKPTLTYYSIMSFALCEILLKRDGNYRLQKLREQHGHHGLEFVIPEVRHYDNLSATDLAARILNRGTFGVWYGTSQQRPIWGEGTTSSEAGSTTGIRIIFDVNGEGGTLKKAKLSELAEICPALVFESGDLRLKPSLARATLRTRTNTRNNTRTWEVIVHPTPPAILEATIAKIKFDPRCVDLVEVHEIESGVRFSISAPLDTTHISFEMPNAFAQDGKIALLRSDTVDLNEFGIYYLSSYIAGMFARYYPEIWENCSNHRTKLYLTIDAMMNAANERAPMLLLEEFRRQIFVLT